MVYQKLRPYEIDPTNGIQERKRKKKYVTNDELLRDLVESFEERYNANNYTNDSLLRHLRALQYRLHTFDFDIIDADAD